MSFQENVTFYKRTDFREDVLCGVYDDHEITNFILLSPLEDVMVLGDVILDSLNFGGSLDVVRTLYNLHLRSPGRIDFE